MESPGVKEESQLIPNGWNGQATTNGSLSPGIYYPNGKRYINVDFIVLCL